MSSSKKIRIYLGPSLPVQEAQKILKAEYKPPVKRGDLDHIKFPSKYIIGIIDGSFHHTLSVSVIEVSQFIKKGGIVFGASSMGALRATELAPLGMKGVGRIYKDYMSRKLLSDEDVALVYSPETGQALTIPTVQIKYAIDMAKKEGLITPQTARKALQCAKKIFYAERILKMLLLQWSKLLSTKDYAILEKIIKDPSLDPKRQDAIELLQAIQKFKNCIK